MKRIVDLKSAENDESLLGDRMGSGCRLGVRRRGWVSGGGLTGGRCDLLLGSVDEQSTQVDELLNAQDDGAVRFFEVEGQGGGHLVGGREVFGGVGQEGFGVDVGADQEQVAGSVFGGRTVLIDIRIV